MLALIMSKSKTFDLLYFWIYIWKWLGESCLPDTLSQNIFNSLTIKSTFHYRFYPLLSGIDSLYLEFVWYGSLCLEFVRCWSSLSWIRLALDLFTFNSYGIRSLYLIVVKLNVPKSSHVFHFTKIFYQSHLEWKWKFFSTKINAKINMGSLYSRRLLSSFLLFTQSAVLSSVIYADLCPNFCYLRRLMPSFLLFTQTCALISVIYADLCPHFCILT